MGAAATAAVSGSPYAIIPGTALGTGLGNYTIVYRNGSLTVNPAPLTITAVSTTIVAGAAIPALAASFSGFAGGDSAASLTTPPALSTTATTTSTTGSYPITVRGASSPNYKITFVDGSLTVAASQSQQSGSPPTVAAHRP